MISVSVPSAARKVYDQLNAEFSFCGIDYNCACALITMLIMGLDSFSETVRRCPWSPSVSSLSRATAMFEPNRFMRRLQNKVLKKYQGDLNPDDFCYAIDDTANPKYGDSIYRRYYFHSSKGPYTGQKVLVIALVDIKRGYAIPLSYFFLTSKKEPGHRSAFDVALDELKELLSAGYPKIPVVADSWFDSVDFIRRLKVLGLDYCVELKSTRLVRENPGLHVKWQKLLSLFGGKEKQRLPQLASQKRRKAKRGKAFSETYLYVKNLGSSLKTIAVYNRINGQKPFAYYATTDLSMTGAKLWMFSRARWNIETLFRDLKQNLSFGRLACEGESGAHLAVCLPLTLIASMRLDGSAIWEKDSKTSIGKTVEHQRKMALVRSLTFIFNNQNHRKILTMKARNANPKVKPTNHCGDIKSA